MALIKVDVLLYCAVCQKPLTHNPLTYDDDGDAILDVTPCLYCNNGVEANEIIKKALTQLNLPRTTDSIQVIVEQINAAKKILKEK